MKIYDLGDLSIAVDQEGSREYAKVSYPLRYGRFSEIRTGDHIYRFNLNGEIKFIQGRGRAWPHPSEWLKRTAGNDWIYYSAGDYSSVYDFIGEYYLPCFSYPSNSILEKSITIDTVDKAFERMLAVNRRYEKIEVTANFVFGSDLPASHPPSIAGLTGRKLDRPYGKGAIYLSPLMAEETVKVGNKREMLSRFTEVKMTSRLPTYIYLIQRL